MEIIELNTRYKFRINKRRSELESLAVNLLESGYGEYLLKLLQRRIKK